MVVMITVMKILLRNQNNYLIKSFFLWLSYKERNTKANVWEKIAATFGKYGKNN